MVATIYHYRIIEIFLFTCASRLVVGASISHSSSRFLQSAEITPDPLEKPQQEWSCDLCKVKVSSEKTLITHLSGKKHKSAYESLKKNRIKIKGGVRWCMLCDAKLLNDGNASSHFKGKRHALNIEKMEKLEAMIC